VIRLLIGLVLVASCSSPQPAPQKVAEKNPAEAPAPAADATAPAASDAEEPRQRTRKAGETVPFSEELADQDQRIASSIRRAEAQPTSFIIADGVAGNYLARARLTGDYQDYAKAEEWIGKAFAINADKDFGPFLSRASLNYTLHRLDRVDPDFERSQKGAKDNIALSGLRLFAANLALQRGQYEDCGRLLDESIALHESVSNISAKAYYELGVGHVDASEALYTKAIGMYHGATREPIAWLHLQLGLSDLGRGRYEDALAHYRDAEKKLSGWYLVDEHLAEVFYLLGKRDESKALYLDIIERTQNPEFMDAMAGIALEEGRKDEAAEYIARATKRYEDLSALYPEAAYGHALDHYLEFGEDNAFTVDLAEKNHGLRPNAEAKMRLAQAYLEADRVPDAKRVILEALATPWTTADLHATAAAVFRKAGDAKRADEQLAKAKAIDPHASE
jgi:tetratricopeptide (TPR) repeat protein